MSHEPNPMPKPRRTSWGEALFPRAPLLHHCPPDLVHLAVAMDPLRTTLAPHADPSRPRFLLWLLLLRLFGNTNAALPAPLRQMQLLPAPGGGAVTDASPTRRRPSSRSGRHLWGILSSLWLALGGRGPRRLVHPAPTTTEIQEPLPALANHAEDLELGLAGGIPSIPSTVEATALFLNGLLQLVAAFPFTLFSNHTRQVTRAILVATLMAALWQKLSTVCLSSALQRISLTLQQATTFPGQETYLQQGIRQAKRGLLTMRLWILLTLQSGNWVWFITLLFWFPAVQPTLQLRIKLAAFRFIITNLILYTHKLITAINNRLGRQPQGRRVPNESSQLELQRFGREPLQFDA
ncbi:unnamed protein product [Urochloa humidicola]